MLHKRPQWPMVNKVSGARFEGAGKGTKLLNGEFFGPSCAFDARLVEECLRITRE